MQLSSDLLAEYAREVSFDSLPDEVVEQTERLVLDSLGCCVGAYTSEPSKTLRETFGDRAAPAGEGATVLGTDREIPVEYAALINGAMVRYLDYNDCYISGSSVCHPSDHIPGLLAVAEAAGRSGRELIEAIVVAYEIQSAGIDTGAIWDNGFDYVTWGTYSAAAAAGKLMGLSHDELVDAIGIAGTSSNGLLVSRLGDVSMWKGVAMPYVVHNAVQACAMAQNGLTGPTAVFEGEGGFFETVARDEVAVEAWGGRDGAPYRITRTNFKPYACGYFMQAPITAVLDLVETHDIAPAEIESIEIEEFEQAVQVLASPEKWSTDLNRETADHSIPYSVAVGILDGEVTPRQYAADRLSDPAVHDLMETVSVSEAPDITRRRAENPGLIPARARVTTAAGSYETEIDYPNGHWKQPMTDDQLEGKFDALAEGLLTEEQAAGVKEWSYSLDSVEDVSSVFSELRV
jgi:2-methylcitrate dehydratase